MMTPDPATNPSTKISAYISSLPDDQRQALTRLRAQIAAAAPEATEIITYAMPGFHQNGALVSYRAFKNHCSLFPMGDAVFIGMQDEIAPYRSSKGTLQFTPDAPLPKELIVKIVKARIAENAQKSLSTKRKKKT